LADNYHNDNAQDKLVKRPWNHIAQDKLDKRPWNHILLSEGMRKVFPDQSVSSVSTILDVGFGKSTRSTQALRIVFPNATIDAIDNSVSALEEVKSDDKTHYFFGDPEFTLTSQKYDLIVLSMVCHCFNHRWRAIDNLISFSLKPGGHLLFVHRTDDFMRAICQSEPVDTDDPAVRDIQSVWSRSEKQPNSNYRLISDHDYIESYLKRKGAKHLNTDTIKIETVTENVWDVIEKQSYSPLTDLKVANLSPISSCNTKVELTLYLYEVPVVDRVVEEAKLIAEVFPKVFRIPSEQIEAALTIHEHSLGYTSKEYEDFRLSAFRAFCGNKSEQETPFKFGIYADLRYRDKTGIRVRDPRWQLWGPEPRYGYTTTDCKTTLIDSLRDGYTFAVPFCCTIWAYLPKNDTSSTIMPDVLSNDNDRNCFFIPLDGNRDHFQQAATGFLKLTEDGWNNLFDYLSKLRTEAMDKQEIVATYYFIFKEGNDPIAFSLQSKEWISLSVVSQLAITAKTFLAEINEGIRINTQKVLSQTQVERSLAKKDLETYEKVKADLSEIRDLWDETNKQLDKKLNGIFELIDPVPDWCGGLWLPYIPLTEWIEMREKCFTIAHHWWEKDRYRELTTYSSRWAKLLLRDFSNEWKETDKVDYKTGRPRLKDVLQDAHDSGRILRVVQQRIMAVNHSLNIPLVLQDMHVGENDYLWFNAMALADCLLSAHAGYEELWQSKQKHRLYVDSDSVSPSVRLKLSILPMGDNGTIDLEVSIIEQGLTGCVNLRDPEKSGSTLLAFLKHAQRTGAQNISLVYINESNIKQKVNLTIQDNRPYISNPQPDNRTGHFTGFQFMIKGKKVRDGLNTSSFVVVDPMS